MILITGGAGYIGGHVAWQLAKSGKKILIVDLEELKSSQLRELCEFEQGDIGDIYLLNRIFKQYDIDSVMHFAAWVIVSESVADPMKYYLNNTMVTGRLVNACVEHGVKHFIFSSTAAVYGMPEMNPVTEDMPCHPINPYGSSKLFAEKMLEDVGRTSDLKYTILRYFNVAGADASGLLGPQKKETTLLVRLAIQTALGVRKQLSINGDDWPTPDGTCIRDYIHVSDLAQAHIDALNYLQKKGKSAIFNCGYGMGYSVKEVASTVVKVAKKPLNTIIAARRPGDPAEVIAENDKIKKQLNWQPKHDDLELIVEDAMRWEKRLFDIN